MNKFTLCFAILLGASTVGCQALQKDDGLERDWLGREKEIVYSDPSKVVAIWTNSVFNEPGKRPVRGLGGRVYFYDGDHSAVRVQGDLTVFLYDDSEANEKANGGKADLRQEATKKVHFSAEEVADSFSPSEFGPSYSFWVPWDEVGGERKQLSVIPVFTDTSSQMLVGEQARHLLPGSDPIKFEDDAAAGTIAQAGFDGRQGGVTHMSLANESKLSLKSSKITLPPSMQRRLRKPPPSNQRGRSWDLRDRVEGPTRNTRNMRVNDDPAVRPTGFQRVEFSSPRSNAVGFSAVQQASLNSASASAPANSKRSSGFRSAHASMREQLAGVPEKPIGNGNAIGNANVVSEDLSQPARSLQSPPRVPFSPFARLDRDRDPSAPVLGAQPFAR